MLSIHCVSRVTSVGESLAIMATNRKSCFMKLEALIGDEGETLQNFTPNSEKETKFN